MKLKGKKDLAAEKLKARERCDVVMRVRVRDAMGPNFFIHQAKYIDAQNSGILAPGEDGEIIPRFEALLAEVKKAEDKRQEVQAEIDACETTLEIEAVIQKHADDRIFKSARLSGTFI